MPASFSPNQDGPLYPQWKRYTKTTFSKEGVPVYGSIYSETGAIELSSHKIDKNYQHEFLKLLELLIAEGEAIR